MKQNDWEMPTFDLIEILLNLLFRRFRLKAETALGSGGLRSTHQKVAECKRNDERTQSEKLQGIHVCIVDLNDVPANGDESDDHDHFDADLVLVEVDLQRLN